jgi:hypothetical protein
MPCRVVCRLMATILVRNAIASGTRVFRDVLKAQRQRLDRALAVVGLSVTILGKERNLWNRRLLYLSQTQ